MCRSALQTLSLAALKEILTSWKSSKIPLIYQGQNFTLEVLSPAFLHWPLKARSLATAQQHWKPIEHSALHSLRIFLKCPFHYIHSDVQIAACAQGAWIVVALSSLRLAHVKFLPECSVCVCPCLTRYGANLSSFEAGEELFNVWHSAFYIA